jgi:hypothetical protein
MEEATDISTEQWKLAFDGAEKWDAIAGDFGLGFLLYLPTYPRFQNIW